MKAGKIAVIEDETDILEVIAYNLSREGFEAFTARDGEEGLRLIRREFPDLVLLDLMLPSLDGLEVCRRLKSDSLTREIPIVMVTAKGEESDIVRGLGMGADDYVVKPFSTRELLERVKAVLRRGPLRAAKQPTDRIVRGTLVIDYARHQIKVDGDPAAFTATEFRILHYLASHPGRVFTRDQILNQVAGEAVFILDRNVDVHIRSVRKKLGKNAELIETVRGVGYRFQGERE